MSENRSSLMLRVSACALALCFVTMPAHAEPMADALMQALNNHPRVGAAIANRDALKQERREYVSDYYPEVNVNLGTGRLYADNSTSRGLTVTRGAGYSWVNEMSVTMRQMIFDGFETSGRVDAATARKDSANFEIADARESLALRVVAVYLDVQRNQEILTRVESQKVKLDDYIHRIEELVKEGVVDEAMAAQARDVRAQLISTEATVQGTLASALADYRESVGHDPDGALTKPTLDSITIESDVEKAVETALNTHPSLRAASLSEAAYEYEADAEEGVLYPDVAGEVSYKKIDQADIIGGEDLDARAMLRVNWTLQTGGEQFARIKKTKYRQSEYLARRQERERAVERSVRAAYADMKSNQHQVEVLQDRLLLSKDLLRTQNTQFEGARITLLQLMQTDNALFNSEMSLLNGEYREMAARYATLAGMGKLQESFSIAPATAPANEANK